MTVALGAAVVLGGGLALVGSHTSRAATVRAEVSPLAPSMPAAAPSAESDPGAISGAVLEALPVAKYTYLRLSTAAGEVWAAVPSANVAVGTRVEIANATRMGDFKSSTLNRTFKEIYFGTLGVGTLAAVPSSNKFSPADVLAQDEQDLPAGHPDIGSAAAPGPVNDSDPLPPGHPDLSAAAGPHGGALPSPAASSDLPLEPIAKARGANARSIAELAGLRQTLAGQRVRIRGQVTKVTPNVQGHTFFHLRDAQATDLVATTNGEPTRGQIATFEGTLRADVDIGIGYSYPVLLENATLVAE